MSFISDAAYKIMRRALNKRIINGEVTVPGSTSLSFFDKNAELTFAVWGDPQVSNYMFAREASFRSAADDVKNYPQPLDALIIAGDVSENGFKCEYRMVSDILNGISENVKHFIIVPGNHDVRMRLYKRQLKVFADFLASVKNGVGLTGNNYFTVTDIKGYKFITLGADRSSFESAYISRKQIKLLETELAKASLTGKPVFVVNHQTLNRHNGLPDTWQTKGDWRGGIGMQSNRIRSVFQRYGNVIFITGHLHYGVSIHNFDDRGTYKCLSVPTIGAGNHGSYSPDAQGYIVSVYDDKIVMRARVFGKGEFVPDEIPNSRITIEL